MNRSNPHGIYFLLVALCWITGNNVQAYNLPSNRHSENPNKNLVSRREAALSFLGTSLITGATTSLLWGEPALAANGEEAGENLTFEELQKRAGQLSKQVEKTALTQAVTRPTDKSVYDFSLPVSGDDVPFTQLIQQQYSDEEKTDPKVKAILVVNIKQDDPVARKTIPELISLATKYGRDANGALAVVCSPTDQGYYEPDTSALIRLKLASEYGYGINPATIITDKVNMLGTGAHPFWRWIQSTCRTPAGLGRIEGNFEKFLVDGRTGLPLRRYPRKYSTLNIKDDIEAVIAGKPLPPARANFLETWREAAADAERDTYRFEKGLNVFDQ